MMFTSQAQSVVESSLIRAKWNAELARMDEAANRLAIYQDDYEEIIRAQIKELFAKENYDRLYYHVNQSQNVLKRIVNEISMVYKVEAQRTLDKKSDRFDALKDEVGMDARMKRANRLTNLMNEVLVRPAVRRGKIVWDIITPDICTVIQNEDDPTAITAACWQRTLANTMGVAGIEYEYMDDLGWWGILDKEFRPKEWFFTPNDTPYRDADGRPVLMLAPLHRQSPESDFWDQDSGRDLYNAAIGIGWKLTLKDYYFKTASFKQLYAIGQGIEIPSNQLMDPTTFIKILAMDPGAKAEVGTLDLQIAIDKLDQSLVFDINGIINTRGISADMWTLSVGEMSGRALKIKNRALLEQRQEQLPTYRQGEAELFTLTRILNNVHAKAYGWDKIPDEATFSIDHGEPEFPDDPKEERDILERDLKTGVISLGKYYQHFNPDVKDEDEAAKAAIKNLNQLKELRTANPTLDEALSGILNSVKKPGAFGQGGFGNENDKGL